MTLTSGQNLTLIVFLGPPTSLPSSLGPVDPLHPCTLMVRALNSVLHTTCSLLHNVFMYLCDAAIATFCYNKAVFVELRIQRQ